MTKPDIQQKLVQEFLASAKLSNPNEIAPIVPAQELKMSSRQNLTLDDLVTRITPHNLHSEQDFGVPSGHEAW